MNFGMGRRGVLHDNGSLHGRTITTWDPTFLTISGSKDKQKASPPLYAVIVVNQPIQSKRQLLSLCNGANWTVLADGGANRVYETRRTHDDDRKLMPDAVVGDLDSVWRDAEVWFRDEGSAIVEDPNQYQTDLQKSLRQVKELVKAWYSDTQPANHVNAVVVGGIGGRFDHAFSQLHHLYQENVDDEYRFNGPIYLVNSESICFLLNKGLNCIKTPVAAGLFRQSVGIIPIGRPSVITTRGLEWNLSEQMTEFGGLVSTSNHIRRDWVEVYTTERVLFTMELHPANADSPVIETSAEEISREMDDEESDDELDSISSGQ